MELRGIFAPATTPFDAAGELDPGALRRNASAYREAGVRGLVLFGTTGEGPLVDEAERVRALSAVREEVGADFPLLAGAGAESTRAAIRLARSMGESGADAVLVTPPTYYRPQMTVEALRDHYLAIAAASPVPVLLYQVPPAYATVVLTRELVAAVADHPHIIGIKDSSGDPGALRGLLEIPAAGFSVLVGNGGLVLEGLRAGAAGAVVTVAALAPRLAASLYQRWREGDEAGAAAIQAQLAELQGSVVGRMGIPGIKAAVDAAGLAGGAPRPPLQALSASERERVRSLLDAPSVPA